MRQHNVEVRLLRAHSANHLNPVALHPGGQVRTVIQELAQSVGIAPATRKQLLWIEPLLAFELGANIVVHWCKPRRIARALERLEVQLGYIHAIPIESSQQLVYFLLYRGMTCRILQVHQLAPVELGILPVGRLLAPLGMLGPEGLADMRQLQPRIHQNGVPVAGSNQVAQELVLDRIGLHRMPTRYMQRAHARLSPTLRQVVHIGVNAVRRIEKRPKIGRLHGHVQAQVNSCLQQVGKTFGSGRPRPDCRPKHPPMGIAFAGYQGGGGPSFFHQNRKVGRQFHHGQGHRLLPDDLHLRVMRIHDLPHRQCLPCGLDADRLCRYLCALHNHQVVCR